jgi:uncharacterized damage-inducible protein DinB
MKKEIEILADQYELVKESRKVLLDYCSTIPTDMLISENSLFGRGSIRNLLVHNANVYQFWLGQQAMKTNVHIPKFSEVRSIGEIRSLYESIDLLATEFVEFAATVDEIDFELSGVKRKESLLKIFTHVITHEFHHKGQILTLSRHLGFTPPDTDIIR